MRKRIICNKCLVPISTLTSQAWVLINYFPSSEGIGFRAKRNQTVILIEVEQAHSVVPGSVEVSGICFWPWTERFSITMSLQSDGRIDSPSHLACLCCADQLRYQHSLFVSPVFASVHPGDVNWVTWGERGCRVAVMVASPLSPSSPLECLTLCLSLQDLLLLPESKWVVL